MLPAKIETITEEKDVLPAQIEVVTEEKAILPAKIEVVSQDDAVPPEELENVDPIITKLPAALFREDLTTTEASESVTEAATILEEIESNTELPELEGEQKSASKKQNCTSYNKNNLLISNLQN